MSQKAFQTLVGLANTSKQHARGLPAQVDATPRWSGVGFSVAGKKYVAPMAQISEMLEMPPATRLPGVQPWVLGVANIRGRLLPLFNLPLYFNLKLGGQKKRHRVLVLETDNLYSGLVVEQAFGVQHFLVDTFDVNATDADPGLSAYMQGSYRDASGGEWAVFDMARLAVDPRFLNAAA